MLCQALFRKPTYLKNKSLAQHTILNEALPNAKLPPHLKRSLNLTNLENGTYDQIVAHLEKELELSGLENDVELTIPTMTACIG